VIDENDMPKSKIPIRSWNEFVRNVRSRGCNLLKRLNEFPNSILVTGCQRSGTTMLSRVITESDAMVNYWFGKDDELAAALILAGVVEHEPRGRYCFQTTYLNECYHEYYQYRNGHKIIWVLRNPVVYSMLHNWNKEALHQLFLRCGSPLLNEKERRNFKILGKYGVSRFKKACYAYVGKTRQAFEFKDHLSPNELLFVEYDELVQNKHDLLPGVYDFISLTYRAEYADKIHERGVGKANNLSAEKKDLIKSICQPVYEKAISSLL
jgi:hypothetical protein